MVRKRREELGVFTPGGLGCDLECARFGLKLLCLVPGGAGKVYTYVLWVCPLPLGVVASFHRLGGVDWTFGGLGGGTLLQRFFRILYLRILVLAAKTEVLDRLDRNFLALLYNVPGTFC